MRAATQCRVVREGSSEEALTVRLTQGPGILREDQKVQNIFGVREERKGVMERLRESGIQQRRKGGSVFSRLVRSFVLVLRRIEDF